MDDSPHHINELQLKIWLSKSPAERLRQFMEDNAALYQFWNEVQKSNSKTPEVKEGFTHKLRTQIFE